MYGEHKWHISIMFPMMFHSSHPHNSSGWKCTFICILSWLFSGKKKKKKGNPTKAGEYLVHLKKTTIKSKRKKISKVWKSCCHLGPENCNLFVVIQYGGVPLVILMTRQPNSSSRTCDCFYLSPSPTTVSLACFLSTANLLVLFIKLAKIAPCIFTS